jgi:hypothetical protein
VPPPREHGSPMVRLRCPVRPGGFPSPSETRDPAPERGGLLLFVLTLRGDEIDGRLQPFLQILLPHLDPGERLMVPGRLRSGLGARLAHHADGIEHLIPDRLGSPSTDSSAARETHQIGQLFVLAEVEELRRSLRECLTAGAGPPSLRRLRTGAVRPHLFRLLPWSFTTPSPNSASRGNLVALSR